MSLGQRVPRRLVASRPQAKRMHRRQRPSATQGCVVSRLRADWVLRRRRPSATQGIPAVASRLRADWVHRRRRRSATQVVLRWPRRKQRLRVNSGRHPRQRINTLQRSQRCISGDTEVGEPPGLRQHLLIERPHSRVVGIHRGAQAITGAAEWP